MSKYTEKPLVMWLQGGPGASSTGYGNFEELGPNDVNMNPRDYTWVSVGFIHAKRLSFHVKSEDSYDTFGVFQRLCIIECAHESANTVSSLHNQCN